MEKSMKVMLGAIVAIVALLVVLIIVIKPEAKKASHTWYKTQSATLLVEKRASEANVRKVNFLWQAAYKVKSSVSDSASTMALLEQLKASAPDSLVQIKAEPGHLTFGWDPLIIGFRFKAGKPPVVETEPLRQAAN